MRVALFTTCLADALFPKAAQATVALLERLGHEVICPTRQTCCGQMHLNAGQQRQAVPLVRHFSDVFGEALSTCDAIVAPSGSCVASVRHQHPRVLAESATVAAKTFELSEFLVDVLGLADVGAWYPHRVTYHPTCHSLRLLRLGDKPLRLLRAVRGIDLAELPDADQCCGFGGTFALKNSATSAAMLADKNRHIVATGASVVAAADSSCLMHIGGGLNRQGATVKTVHLAEILASTEQP